MKLSPLWSGATVTAVILLLVLALNHHDQGRLEARQQAEAEQELRLLQARIEGLRDKYLYLGAALAAHAATHPDVSPSELTALLQRLAQDDELLRRITLLRGNETSHIYMPAASAAGGEILRLRLPLVVQQQGVRGEIEIGLDQPALLARAGLHEAGERLQLALRTRDGRMLAGSAELLDSAGMEMEIDLPDDRWILAGRPRPLPGSAPWHLLLGGVCAALGGLLAWMLRREQLHTRRLALHDCLTGLPNRRLLQDRVQQACAAAARSRRQIVLMYLDLDNFKPVNDGYGHQAGDIVLCEVARRLRGCVRRSDTVARVSGDEFVMVLEELVTAREAEAVAEKVLLSFAQPIVSGEHAFVLGCSIGLVSMEPGCDVDQALVRADSAMYQAKRDGKNSYRWYSAEPEQLELAVPVMPVVA